MTILKSAQNGTTRIIFLLGEGLIGAAVVRALERLGCFEIQRTKNEWNDRIAFERQLEQTVDTLVYDRINRIDWIWSAGKSGFNSTVEDTTQEWWSFNCFLRVIKAYESRFKNVYSYFHLISSAGGLFEGQRVNVNSLPNPCRPYGKLKYDQEEQIRSMFVGKFSIYRPSTVYGYYRRGQRSGLISTLIRNVFINKVTMINGHPDTLRDFIWIDDVADFISEKISFDSPFGNINFLVSGKPTSIFEVIDNVQRISNCKVLFSFDTSMSNSHSIIFDSELVPEYWCPTNLDIGLRKVRESAMDI